MKRTRHRPLPSGRLSVPHAVIWASGVGVAGIFLLASKANSLAAGLAASNLALYAFVYTPLKQMHPVNTWIGALVGAIPPLLGHIVGIFEEAANSTDDHWWAAATGEVSHKGIILSAALYFWQIPHFMALGYLCRGDYIAGGFRMFSLTDASGWRTALVSLRNCLYLLPIGYLAYDCTYYFTSLLMTSVGVTYGPLVVLNHMRYQGGITSVWFSIESSVLTLCTSAAAMSFVLDRTAKKARRMFHASLIYLPVFMLGMVIHRLPNDAEEHMTESSKFDEILMSEIPVQKGNSSRSVLSRDQPGLPPRPPVAYASVAPFPFLPAPLYAASDAYVVH